MRFSTFLLLLVLLLLQTTVLNFITIFGVKPDLVMLVVVFNGFLLGTREGAFLGFAGGIMEDLFTGSYIGLNALSKMAAGYLAGAFGVGLYKENPIIAAVVTLVSTTAALVINYALLLLVKIYVPSFYAFFRIILPVAAYTAILAPFFYGRFVRYTIKTPARDL
ncbi:MAG: rod shape-determining protein MreD [Eubacteriales bacterium]